MLKAISQPKPAKMVNMTESTNKSSFVGLDFVYGFLNQPYQQRVVVYCLTVLKSSIEARYQFHFSSIRITSLFLQALMGLNHGSIIAYFKGG